MWGPMGFWLNKQPLVQVCPKAWTAIVTNPVNSTVAIAAEVFKAQGCYDPKKLFGITTLDVVRSQTFIAEIVGCEPMEVRFWLWHTVALLQQASRSNDMTLSQSACR